MSATIISEASIGTAVTRTNLCKNPRLGTNSTGWGHFGFATGAAGAGSRAATHPDSPWWWQLLFPANATAVNSNIIASDVAGTSMPVTPGQVYSASILGYVSWAGASTRAFLRFLTAAGATVSTVLGTDTPHAAGTAQVRTVENAVAPPTAAYAAILFVHGSGTLPLTGDILAASKAQLIQGATVGDYFDGSSAATGIFTYSWTGTAHASTSIETETLYNEIAPELLTSTLSGRDLRTLIVNVPGSSTPYVSLEPSGLRTGTLEMFFARDEDAAAEAEAIIAAGGVFFLDYPERESWEMRFIPVGRLERRLDESTRDHWTVSFDYQELAA